MSENIMSKEELELFEKKKAILGEYAKKIQYVNDSSARSSRQSEIELEALKEMIANPERYHKELVQISDQMYKTSGIYKRMVHYVSTSSTYSYVVDPIVNLGENFKKKKEVERYKESYMNAIQRMGKINFKDEFSRIFKIALVNDVVYLYEHEDKDSLYLQQLPHDYCRISSITDGVFGFAMDFSYFDGKEVLLDSFPPEFKNKFLIYKNDRNMQWQEINPNKSFAFKYHNEYPNIIIPPFVSMLPAIKELEDGKKRAKLKQQMDNFMILVQNVPLNDKSQSANQFRVELDTAFMFHDMIEESLPENFSLITSGLPIEAIKMDKKATEDDITSKATREIFDEAGITQFLFNSEKSTAIGVKSSIKAIEQMTFDLISKVERWSSRRLKTMSGEYKFKTRFLDITHNSKEEAISDYIKTGSTGTATRRELMAASGQTPLEALNSFELESVLGLQEKMQPLASSHTMKTGDSVGGRPKKDLGEISEKTEEWQNSNDV